MHDLAPRLAEPIHYYAGRVTEAGARKLRVEFPLGEFDAVRATSCLLEPREGDRVLLVGPDEGDFYVTAVLRRDGSSAEISVDGDLELRAGGTISIAARDDLDLVAAGKVQVATRVVEVKADAASVALGALRYLGGVVRGEVGELKLVAGRLDSAVERVTSRVKSSFRFVEETDRLTAERVDYTAKKSLSLHGENALVTADELVKIDGEQIHVG